LGSHEYVSQVFQAQSSAGQWLHESSLSS